MYQGIFSSNTKALRDYVHILPWQMNKIFVIAVNPFRALQVLALPGFYAYFSSLLCARTCQ